MGVVTHSTEALFVYERIEKDVGYVTRQGAVRSNLVHSPIVRKRRTFEQ